MIKLLYIDLFCGAGGTTTGVEAARINGRKIAKVIACVNHDANAIASHAANHPSAMHYTEDIRTLDIRPLKELADRQLKRHKGAKLVLWASLECTNFSRAKGGKPRDPDSRIFQSRIQQVLKQKTAIGADGRMYEFINPEELFPIGSDICVRAKALEDKYSDCYSLDFFI